MKNIRRSLNKDKERQSSGSSVQSPTYRSNMPSPPLPAQGFQPLAPRGSAAPPKKVIRAIQSYRAQSPIELSFEKGDFFHVVGERPDQGLFDAANPATGSRGLVPQHCFQVLGRNERESGKSNTSPQPSPGLPPTSGGGTYSSAGPGRSQPQQQPSVGRQSTSQTNAQTGTKGQSLYGVVIYDFEAQRADELDAKKGEPIIVIAQSNHEWFVAKPIGRLGGPGLIPVSFVEIQNMATGKALDPNVVQEMIRGGALPPVEEWKKSTAEYKQQSIPLGRFDFAGQPQPSTGSSASSMTNGRGPANGAPSASSGGSTVRQSTASQRQVASHYESGSARLTPAYPPTHASHSSPQLGSAPERHSYETDERGRFSSSNQSYSGTGTGASSSMDDGGTDADRYGLVRDAYVESFHFEEGSYWFHLRVAFESGARLVLYRLYDDFYDFQMGLMQAFPVEAGKELPPGAPRGEQRHRIIPMMPGPADVVDEVVCSQRVVDLSEYLTQLVGKPSDRSDLPSDPPGIPEYMLRHKLVYSFFLTRPGDVVEVEPGRASQPGQSSREPTRYGTEEAENGLVEYLGQMDAGGRSSQRLSNEMGALSLGTGGGRSGAGTYDDATYRPSSAAAARSTPSPAPLSAGSSGPGNSRYASSASTPAAQPPPSTTSNGPPPAFIKIKIFQRTTDDLIAIRVPPNVTLGALVEKARDRLGADISSLKWKEDLPGLGPGGGARLVELGGEGDLERWLKSGQRMVLYAD